MRLVNEHTELEWPDEVGSRQARAALLFYFADRYAELIEWAALRCDADGEPLSGAERSKPTPRPPMGTSPRPT